MRIGLVGCGAIGTQLAGEIRNQFQGKARLIGVYDRNLKAVERLTQRLKARVPLMSSEELLRKCDLLIEAASSEAVSQLLPKVIRYRRPMMVMSAGGLLRNGRFLRKAIERKVPIYLPSGALAGIDGVKSAASGKLRSVTLTTRKPPQAFKEAPGVIKRKINISTLRRPRLLFQGSAKRAVAEFPQNVNVAATLALAGLGALRTKVRVVADPTVKGNIHEVEAAGDFGRMKVRLENRPSPENPRTSRLAVLSAMATLRQILQPVRLGT